MAWRGRRAAGRGRAARLLLLLLLWTGQAGAAAARAGGPDPAPLTPRDLLAMEQALTDRGLATAGPTPLLEVSWWRRAEAAPEAVGSLAARAPAVAADGAVRLPKGWKAQRIRLAAVPRLDEDRKDPAPALHALAAIAGRPSAASVLRWPELGARREAGGRVTWLVPGIVTPGPGPVLRAWFLLEYRGGKLVAAVATAGEHLAAATYGWEEGG